MQSNLGQSTSQKLNQELSENQCKLNQQLIESQQCIQRMEIASLKRFVFIRSAKYSNDYKAHLLFFTPAEELNGGNIFAKVSSNYSVMQPYLEKIDADFIKLMNQNVQNIALYVKPNFFVLNNIRVIFETATDDVLSG
jgi:hypothetical protein